MVEAWEEGLAEEARTDRSALARLLGNPKFAYGRVEVETDDAEDLLRGLTELRLAIRVASLAEVPDEVLESGGLALEERKLVRENRLFCLSYPCRGAGKLNRRSRLAWAQYLVVGNRDASEHCSHDPHVALIGSGQKEVVENR